MQNFGKLCLRAARIVAQSVDQVDLRRADSVLAQRAEYQLFRFPRDLCDFPFGNIHNSSEKNNDVYTSLYIHHYSTPGKKVNSKVGFFRTHY